MVQYCCVPGCKGNALLPGISLHNIPREEKARNKWIVNIKRGGRVSLTMRVCSQHFRKEDYMEGGKIKRLKKEAVPSVFSFTSTKKLKTSLLNCSIVSGKEVQKIYENIKNHDTLKHFEGEKKGKTNSLQEKCVKTVFEDLGSFSKDMENLFLKMDDADVTLSVNERKFNAHRLILESRSPEFRKLLRQSTIGEKDGELQIPGCDPDAFEDFLCYLYTGKVEISENNVIDLYYISERYETINLSQRCIEFIQENLTVDSFCGFVSVALQSGLLDVLERAVSFFSVNFKQITKSNKWKAFIDSNPSAAKELINKAVDNI